MKGKESRSFGPIIDVRSPELLLKIAAAKLNDLSDQVVSAKVRSRMLNTLVDPRAPRMLHVVFEDQTENTHIDRAELMFSGSERTESIRYGASIELGVGAHDFAIEVDVRGDHPVLPYYSGYERPLRTTCPKVVFEAESLEPVYLLVRLTQEPFTSLDQIELECRVSDVLADAPEPSDEGRRTGVRLSASAGFWTPTSREFSTSVFNAAPGAQVQALFGLERIGLPRVWVGARVGLHHAARQPTGQTVTSTGFDDPDWAYTIAPVALVGAFRLVDTDAIDLDLAAFAGAIFVRREFWAAGDDTFAADVIEDLSRLGQIGLTPELTLADTFIAAVDLGASPYTIAMTNARKIELHLNLRLGARF